MSQDDGLNKHRLHPSRSSRRKFLGKVVAATAAVSGPFIFVRRSSASGKVIVRTAGGAYEDGLVKAVYAPFTKATGIEVVRVQASAGKLMAMVESGNMELDAIDFAEYLLLLLRGKGALDRIEYKNFKFTNPADIAPGARREDMAGSIFYSSVLTYNTQVFPTGKHPRSWAEFWDIKRFPGPRMLQDLSAGWCDLEWALLADGVPKEKIYPIDVDRAFRSLDRVRPAIRKFWETGSIAAQMLADKEVVLGPIANGRAQALIDKGAPLAIEWNQAMSLMQFWAIFKKAPNRDNAQKLVDFALQPQVQAEITRYIPYGPTNPLAFKYIAPDIARNLPSQPTHMEKAIIQNVQWWVDNRARINERWSQWLLGGR